MSTYSIIYRNTEGQVVHISSKACGGQDRIEWGTFGTALKWLREYQKIHQTAGLTCPDLYITEDGAVVDPEVTAVSGSYTNGFTLYGYNGHLKLTLAQLGLIQSRMGGSTRSPSGLIGANMSDIRAILEENPEV